MRDSYVKKYMENTINIFGYEPNYSNRLDILPIDMQLYILNFCDSTQKNIYYCKNCAKKIIYDFEKYLTTNINRNILDYMKNKGIILKFLIELLRNNNITIEGGIDKFPAEFLAIVITCDLLFNRFYLPVFSSLWDIDIIKNDMFGHINNELFKKLTFLNEDNIDCYIIYEKLLKEFDSIQLKNSSSAMLVSLSYSKDLCHSSPGLYLQPGYYLGQ